MNRPERLAAGLAALSAGGDPRDLLARVAADVGTAGRERLEELLEELAAAREAGAGTPRAGTPGAGIEGAGTEGGGAASPRAEGEITADIERLLRRIGSDREASA